MDRKRRHHKKNNRKKSNKQNKAKKRQNEHNKHTENDNDYEGDIFVVHVKSSYWGILRGSILLIYVNKTNLNVIPYDVIDLSKYVDVKSYGPLLTLFRENDASKLCFSFQNQINRRKWFLSLKNAIHLHKNRTVKQNNHNRNIRYDGFSVMNKKYVFIELQKNGILNVFNNLSEKNEIMKIKVTDCQNVYIPINTHQNAQTVFQYVFELTMKEHKKNDAITSTERKCSFCSKVELNMKRCANCKKSLYCNVNCQRQHWGIHKKTCKKPTSFDSNNTLLFAFKSNNHRHEWFAHIDYTMHKKTNKTDIIINDAQHENKQHDEMKANDTNINYNKSIKMIESALTIYNEWENNTDKQESLQSYLTKKLSVNYVDILNYYHCVIFDEHRNIKRENDIHFECKLGKKCDYIKRHRVRNQRRFNINDGKTNGFLLSELLDKAHSYLYHWRNINNINDTDLIRDNISNKFVINIDAKNDKGNDNYQEEKVDNNDASMFAFGCAFDFYDKKYGNYVRPKYLCLKQELISNPYYSITTDQYYKLYLVAVELRQSAYIKNIKASAAGSWNTKSGININDPISINHIISLSLYCNETEIQTIYKKHTRKIKSNELHSSVIKRQTFIAHWTRYLTESCLFYGTPLRKNESVYCGVNTKLLFNALNFDNCCPLSTSTEINVANNFATHKGIIMKLQLNDIEGNCCYFDMIGLSDYPAERERFFCGSAKFKFADIILEGKNNDDKISALRLLQLILNGSLFYYDWNKDSYTDQIQHVLIRLLNDYINFNDSDYFNKLTSSLIDSFIHRTDINDPFGEKMMILNLHQILKLKTLKLKNYFNPLSETNLFSSKRVNKNIQEFELAVTKNMHGTMASILNKKFQLYVTKEIQHIELSSSNLKRIKKIKDNFDIIEIGKFNVNDFQFQFGLSKTYRHFNIVMELQSNDIPYGLKISWDIVCKEVQYQRNQIYCKLAKETNWRTTNDIFLCSKIKKLKHLSFDLHIRVVGLTMKKEQINTSQNKQQ